MDEFILPKCLQESDVDDIHSRMMAELPDDFDKSEGGFFWDFTRPTALEVSELKGYVIPQVLMLVWPSYATGAYLDYHGETRGIGRKEAIRANGFLEITAKKGTRIPAGSIFSTESKNGIASIDYVVKREGIVPEEGMISIDIEAVVSGTSGNAAKGTVIMNSSNVDGLTGITNTKEITGGIDEESDEDYRGRIVEYDKTRTESFVGNEADYKRWAESVKGTGRAQILSSQDDKGLITIVLTAGDGKPASSDLCKDVYNKIMSPDQEKDRLAPINASLKVIAPETMYIKITAIVELNSGTVEAAKSLFVAALKKYMPNAITDRELRYTKVCRILEETVGIYDFKDLMIDGETKNVILQSLVVPLIREEDVVFEEGSV